MKARGFTLIEVMIAAAITAIIGGMVMGSFMRTYSAQQIVQQQDERYAEARLALSRMAREVSMSFVSEHYDRKRYRERPTFFQGKENSLLTTTMSHARLARDAKESDQALVEYRVGHDRDLPDEDALFRREKAIIDDSPDRGGTDAKLCEHVTKLDLSYWDWKKQEWVREWSSNSADRLGMLPTRVRIRLTVRLPGDGNERGKEKTFETQARVAIVRPLDF